MLRAFAILVLTSLALAPALAAAPSPSCAALDAVAADCGAGLGGVTVLVQGDCTHDPECPPHGWRIDAYSCAETNGALILAWALTTAEVPVWAAGSSSAATSDPACPYFSHAYGYESGWNGAPRECMLAAAAGPGGTATRIVCRER
ncbi:MAG TPA: hypothetical protein VFH78_06410 [Candidatus Thermoplasmatota archaeon]|nr:hypothetical protein [Candidatus Thermoplasmatota archaeon]